VHVPRGDRGAFLVAIELASEYYSTVLACSYGKAGIVQTRYRLR